MTAAQWFKNDCSADVQPDMEASGAVQETVQRMIDNVIGNQEKKHLPVRTLSSHKQFL